MRRSSSRINVRSARAYSSKSSVGTSRPSSPWVMISRGPTGQSLLTTGRPSLMASTMVIPNDSRAEETAAMDPLTHSAVMSSRRPISSTWPYIPNSRTSLASPGRCSPSP
ncbi:hypothetical protein D2L64_21625 [Micromonospora radicis]|uniref:Uncharacterized protein n=1 Tax=Micromonospora radicis TaxID=1894971 RepID=A0A418MQ39_9ACTN|nr:hypothetical protein D2L64_21625 [Micromonospora radicis]